MLIVSNNMGTHTYIFTVISLEPHFTVCYAVLLNQIMQLSPAQIDGLPPEQKAQVLALQQQMVSLVIQGLCTPHHVCTPVALVSVVV